MNLIIKEYNDIKCINANWSKKYNTKYGCTLYNNDSEIKTFVGFNGFIVSNIINDCFYEHKEIIHLDIVKIQEYSRQLMIDISMGIYKIMHKEVEEENLEKFLVKNYLKLDAIKNICSYQGYEFHCDYINSRNYNEDITSESIVDGTEKIIYDVVYSKIYQG